MSIISLLILKYLFFFLYWFFLSLLLHLKLAKGDFCLFGLKFNQYTSKLTFIENFMVLFTFFYLSFMLFYFLLFYNLGVFELNLGSSDFLTMAEGAPNKAVDPNPNNSSNAALTSAGNSAIMAAAVAAGGKVAATLHTPMQKTVALAGSIGMGVVAIGAKGLTEQALDKIGTNNSNSPGSNSFNSVGIDDILSNFFNLT